MKKKYDFVICGHIHQPQKKVIETKNGKVIYLNSGDWVENLTALEYTNNEWTIYQYDETQFESASIIRMDNKIPELTVVTDEVSLFINSLRL